MNEIRERIAGVMAAEGVGATDRIAVACSGGPDSMVLAHAVMALAAEGRVGEVVLVHVDHGLREGSEADGDRVKGLGERGGARVIVVRVQVDRRGSLEAAARDQRYAALDRVAQEVGVRWVLTAHTADDQAETVLMRLIRGTGVVGLAGIPRRRGRYLRPLLGTWRREVEAYAVAAGLACADDPMNRDLRFLRNQVRHRILPALRAREPEVDRRLVLMADAAREQAGRVTAAARALLAAADRPRGEWAISADALAAASPAVSGRALALAAIEIGGRPLGAAHLRALRALVQRRSAGTIALDLPGLRAVREYGRLRLIAPGGARAAAPCARVHGAEGPYAVRSWRPGDRMRPARLRGRSRKLSDLYTDAKIPREQRAGALVVVRERDGTIVWAQHFGPAWESVVEVTLTYPDPGASNETGR